jgi:predicted MFS family arabinose efflux permease
MLLVGQAVGIALVSRGEWWKGRLWPQLAAQALVLIAAIAVFLTSSEFVFAAAFVALGVSLVVAYTAALYYGMQSRKDMGRNTSIHESLVALGNIAGAASGGAVATHFNLRAPYGMIAALAAIMLFASLAVRARSEA